MLGDDCKECMSSNNSEVYDSNHSMELVEEIVVFSYVEDVSMELSCGDTHDESVAVEFGDIDSCHSIDDSHDDIKSCMHSELVEEMRIDDVDTSITDISDVESEDDGCYSVYGFLYLTLGVDSELSYNGGEF